MSVISSYILLDGVIMLVAIHCKSRHYFPLCPLRISKFLADLFILEEIEKVFLPLKGVINIINHLLFPPPPTRKELFAFILYQCE